MVSAGGEELSVTSRHQGDHACAMKTNGKRTGNRNGGVGKKEVDLVNGSLVSSPTRGGGWYDVE